VAVASAGPYADRHLTPDTTTAASHQSAFLQAGCPSCHPTNSIKADHSLPFSAIPLVILLSVRQYISLDKAERLQGSLISLESQASGSEVLTGYSIVIIVIQMLQ